MTLNKRDAQNEFKQLAFPHMQLLYNVALKYCGNVFDAQDIVQETYMMAFNNFHQLRDRSKCKPWLFRILRNNFLKNYQKSKQQQQLADGDYVEFLKTSLATDSAATLLEKAQVQEVLRAAIDALPVKYKDVLILYYMDELLYKEIAQVLNIPIGTVMSRLNRARDALKIHLLEQNRSDLSVLDIAGIQDRNPA